MSLSHDVSCRGYGLQASQFGSRDSLVVVGLIYDSAIRVGCGGGK